MTNEDLMNFGFLPIAHFTIGNTMILPLGRYRQLSASCMGTPNEMIFIGEVEKDKEEVLTDIICAHNYDYDGYITEKKLSALIYGLTGQKP